MRISRTTDAERAIRDGTVRVDANGRFWVCRPATVREAVLCKRALDLVPRVKGESDDPLRRDDGAD